MATAAQINANRQNAKKSTGPRTPQGKAISSRNSLLHGMTSGKFLPPGTDPSEFFQLLDRFRSRFQPFDEVEDALVERLAAAEFKMRSIRYLDAGLFQYQLKICPMPEPFSADSRTNPVAWAFQCDAARNNALTKLIRYEGFLQREFSRALRELYMMQDERRARQSEAEAESAPSEPEAGRPEAPTARIAKKTSRTQFPGRTAAPQGRPQPVQPRNPSRNPFPAAAEGPPHR